LPRVKHSDTPGISPHKPCTPEALRGCVFPSNLPLPVPIFPASIARDAPPLPPCT
jgi:hypothetical protein